MQSSSHHPEHGSALILALLASSLLAALGLALAGLAVVETAISSNHRASSQAFYAADAAFEGVLSDLLATPNWTDILNGSVSSRLAGHPVPPVAAGEVPRSLAQLHVRRRRRV